MATFRILNQAPQYLLPSGKVNAGGSLSTYETDLSTPKGTWADPDKATPNATTILLDAAGRTAVDVWGDGEYGLVMKDAAGVTIWTRNNVRMGGDAEQTIPELDSGKFLTNDGSNLEWAEILQVPDPTGTDGYMLYSDGEEAYWGPAPAVPEPPTPDIVVADASLTVSGGGSYKSLVQFGTATVPANNAKSSSVNVTLPTALAEIQHVTVTSNTSSVTTSGSSADLSATNYTYGSAATSFTIVGVVSEEQGGSSTNKLANPITVNWRVEGLVAA